jgi:hypothetical protein
MTQYTITVILAGWALIAFATAGVFGRIVRCADEESELGSLRREVRAADALR